MDNESCYAAIRLTQKGTPTQNVPLTYPRKKFDPRKITHAKLSVKRTHDPRKFTHNPRKVTHVPRPTTHDPRSFSNPRDPRNPRNLAHSFHSRKQSARTTTALILATHLCCRPPNLHATEAMYGL